MKSHLSLNDISNLSLSSTSGNISIGSLIGKNVIFYFYPKDDTPGCTLESQDFAKFYPEFVSRSVEIYGISRDDLNSHAAFRDKYCLPFPLISDIDGALCEAFGVWIEKSMFGKHYMGIDRSTFLFDKTGSLVKEWRKVSVKGHAETLLQAVEEL
jgi:peroxiredoxin Q/BCP